MWTEYKKLFLFRERESEGSSSFEADIRGVAAWESGRGRERAGYIPAITRVGSRTRSLIRFGLGVGRFGRRVDGTDLQYKYLFSNFKEEENLFFDNKCLRTN